MSKLKFEDIEVGDEFFVKVKVTMASKVFGVLKYIEVEMDEDVPDDTEVSSHGELTIYGTDIHNGAVVIKHPTKAQRNAKTNLKIKLLEKQLKAVRRKLV